MELRYLSEIPLSTFLQKLSLLWQRLPPESSAIIQLGNPNISQAHVDAYLEATCQAQANNLGFTWLASQQLNISKLFPLKSGFAVYNKDLKGQSLQFYPDFKQAKANIAYPNKLYTYFSEQEYNLAFNPRAQLATEFDFTQNSNFVSLLPEFLWQNLVFQDNLSLDSYALALWAGEINSTLSYPEERAVQHAAENLAFSISSFWKNAPLYFAQNYALQQLNYYAQGYNLNELSFAINPLKIEKISYKKRLPLQKAINPDYFHADLTTILTKQHNLDEQSALSKSLHEPYLAYLQQLHQHFDLTEQALAIEGQGSYLGYQAKVKRVLYLHQDNKQATKPVHDNPERKRGAQATNNHDHLLTDLNLDHKHQFLDYKEQVELSTKLELVQQLELNTQRSLRPGISLAQAVLSGILNSNCRFSQLVQEVQPSIIRLFPLIYLQKNNKHLVKLEEQLNLEATSLWESLFSAIYQALSKRKTAQFTANEQLNNTYTSLFASQALLEVRKNQPQAQFSCQDFTISVENLHTGLLISPDTRLETGMAIAITYQVGNISQTDSYIIADNLVLRKKLTVNL
ncbi:hypothetical protein CJP74_06180 [Psittacicella melopsittaci]|uniref:Uncharacterized protein n=1 Tax=Psittacicella melopsittaci TaxID=2028576 RepID=A0A3A1Y3N9_9GAMM|nr:hypothetical protein [Psittacicella melopsittaci]RIY31866.1 hypothetical protein CJP74_06180 [Psittacicella melopsittaci]